MEIVPEKARPGKTSRTGRGDSEQKDPSYNNISGAAAVPFTKPHLVPPGDRRFGRYTLFCRLARGGMANLYLAQYSGPEGFEKLVAIKRIHDHLSEDKSFITMFSDEARLAARISHPNVAQVLELGFVDSSAFIAMEYVHGEHLGALIKRGKVALPIVARIISQAAMGLHAAHELKDINGEPLNVVHRDVSPQNVLISYDGVVKVVDFGVAKAQSNIAQTGAGTVKGKFAYMSPEQLKPGEYGDVDRRADVFALGILLYEASTRRNLFRGKNNGETIEKVLYKEITPPSELVRDYPPMLESIVLRALERDREKRFQSANSLHQALEAFLAYISKLILPSHMTELMTIVFAEQKEAKAGMLRQAQEFEPEGDESYSQISTVAAPRSRLGLIVALSLIAAVGLGFIWFLFAAAPPPRTQRIAMPAPAPVKVVIKTTPSAASITFDGKKVGNPYVSEQRRDNRKVAVKVAAPGFVSKEFDVSLQEGGRFMVDLERLPPVTRPAVEPPARVTRPRRPRIRRKRPKPPPGKKHIKKLFTNPYDS